MDLPRSCQVPDGETRAGGRNRPTAPSSGRGSNDTSFKHEGGKTAKIELQDASLKKVADWTLRHVMPVKWSIVPFDAAGNKVATETLELAHTGFLDEAK